jgi:AraC-like DNA-binding protein
MEKIMLLTAVAVSLISLGLMIARSLREELQDDDIRPRLALIITAINMSSLTLLALSDLLLYPCASVHMISGALPMIYLLSSQWGESSSVRNFAMLCSPQVLAAAYQASSAAGLHQISCELFVAVGIAVICAAAVLVFLRGHWQRIGDVKMLIRDSSIWNGLCRGVDSVYYLFIVICAQMTVLGLCMESIPALVIQPLAFILSVCLLSALIWRLFSGRLMVLLRKQEDRILDSLKISQVENASGARPDLYKELYERILDYFDSEKPYLKPNLTINDIVKVVFSNKTYISRVISLFTGRNFCQFVNYYRVSHAMERFRDNPNMKINEMSAGSGFNSIVSFNTAFRLFTGENPSDWCRKERHKLMKKR